MDKIILAGSSNPELAARIAKRNKVPLAEVEISHFPNQEKRVHILTDLKDKEVIIVQSTCDKPDEHLFETLLLADAAKRMGAGKIGLIMPWFSYAKQDKVFRPGEPLSAEVVINLLDNSPIDSFNILDIHAAELLKLFKKPVTHQTAMALFKKYYQRNKKICKESITAVAVDQGSYERAQEFAKCLQVDLAKFSKFRNKSSGAVCFTGFAGAVKGKNLVAFDDFVNTGATLVQSAQELKQKGARSYCFCVTHVVVPSAMAKIINDPAIDMVITTNTVARDLKHPKMVVLDAAGLFRLK